MEPSKEAGSEAVSGKAPGLGPVVQIDEGRVRRQLLFPFVLPQQEMLPKNFARFCPKI